MPTMQARVVALLFPVLVAGLVASSSLAQTTPAETEMPRPEWSIGDWWEFSGTSGSTWRLTVIAREGDHYILTRSARGQAVEDGRGRTTYHVDLDGWTLKTTTRDAKVTEGRDEVGGPSSQLHMFDYECRVEGWETIDIGGHSVRALKISYAQRKRGTRDYGRPITGWYAPDAKRLVRLRPSYEGGPPERTNGRQIPR
jgi:hypothetical protein